MSELSQAQVNFGIGWLVLHLESKNGGWETQPLFCKFLSMLVDATDANESSVNDVVKS